MLQISYQPANEDIVFEEFDGDLVVLNLQTGQYFGFNPSAATLWALLMQGHTPEILIKEISNLKNIPDFISSLLTHKLVRPNESSQNDSGSIVIEQTAIDVEPIIESYDDLSDLIIADPIHDVDEQAGWPAMPKQD